MKKIILKMYLLLSYPVLLILFRIDYLSMEGADKSHDVEMFLMGFIFAISPITLPISLLMLWFRDIGLYMMG